MQALTHTLVQAHTHLRTHAHTRTPMAPTVAAAAEILIGPCGTIFSGLVDIFTTHNLLQETEIP